MAESNLYKVLSGLNTTDTKIWGKLSGLISNISGAFTADKVTVGTGTGLSASVFSIGATDATGFGANNEIAVESAVTGYVANAIGAMETVVTAVTPEGALSANIANHTLTIGTKVDGITIVQSGGILESPITLKKLGSPDAAYAAQYQLQNGAGTAIGDTINIPRDQFLSGVTYDASTEKLNFTFIIADGEGGSTAQNLEVSVADMVHEYQGSNAIDVDVTTDGDSTISLKLDGTGEDFLSITSNGLLLSGVQDAIDAASSDATAGLTALSGRMDTAEDGLEALSGRMTTAEGNIGTLSTALTDYTGANAVKTKFAEVDGGLGALSGALEGYTGAKAVSAEFAALDGRLDDLETKTSGSITENHLVKGDASGNYVDSGVVAGSDSTLSGAFGTANTLATEVAAKAYTDGAIAAANSEAADAYIAKIGDSGTDNHVVLFDGDGDAVKDSGKTVGSDTVSDASTYGSTPDVLATEAGVKAYVEDGLAGLLTSIGNLQAEIG